MSELPPSGVWTGNPPVRPTTWTWLRNPFKFAAVYRRYELDRATHNEIMRARNLKLKLEQDAAHAEELKRQQETAKAYQKPKVDPMLEAIQACGRIEHENTHLKAALAAEQRLVAELKGVITLLKPEPMMAPIRPVSLKPYLELQKLAYELSLLCNEAPSRTMNDRDGMMVGTTEAIEEKGKELRRLSESIHRVEQCK